MKGNWHGIMMLLTTQKLDVDGTVLYEEKKRKKQKHISNKKRKTGWNVCERNGDFNSKKKGLATASPFKCDYLQCLIRLAFAIGRD